MNSWSISCVGLWRNSKIDLKDVIVFAFLHTILITLHCVPFLMVFSVRNQLMKVKDQCD